MDSPLDIYNEMLKPLRDRYEGRGQDISGEPEKLVGYAQLACTSAEVGATGDYALDILQNMLKNKERRLIALVGEPYSGKSYTLWELVKDRSALAEDIGGLQPIYLPLAYLRFDKITEDLYGLIPIAHPHLRRKELPDRSTPHLFILDDAQLSNPHRRDSQSIIHKLVVDHIQANERDRIIVVLHIDAPPNERVVSWVEGSALTLQGFSKDDQNWPTNVYVDVCEDNMSDLKQFRLCSDEMDNPEEAGAWSPSWPLFIDTYYWLGIAQSRRFRNSRLSMLQGSPIFFRTMLTIESGVPGGVVGDVIAISEERLRQIASNVLMDERENETRQGELEITQIYKDVKLLQTDEIRQRVPYIFKVIVAPDLTGELAFPFFTASLPLYFLAWYAATQAVQEQGKGIQIVGPISNEIGEFRNPVVRKLFIVELVGILCEIIKGFGGYQTDYEDLLKVLGTNNYARPYSLNEEIERLKCCIESLPKQRPTPTIGTQNIISGDQYNAKRDVNVNDH